MRPVYLRAVIDWRQDDPLAALRRATEGLEPIGPRVFLEGGREVSQRIPYTYLETFRQARTGDKLRLMVYAEPIRFARTKGGRPPSLIKRERWTLRVSSVIV